MPNTYFINDEILNVHCNSAMGLERSKLASEVKKYNIPLEQFRIFDSASNAVLPNAAVSDDLGLILGTFGTSDFSIQTSDAKATTVTQKARFRFWLPPEYDAGQAVQIVAYGGMLTTISDGTATVDFNVYKKDAATGLVGSDLVTTAATTINSLTAGADVFDLTTTGFVNGDELTGMVTIAITDTATGTAVIGKLTKIYYQITVRG